MINFCFKSSAIALMGLILMSLPAIAEPDTENSTDIANPTENGIQEGLDKDKPAISVESKKSKELQIGDIVEVHPRTEMWETIHSGDLNRGTLQFKFITE